MSQKCIIYLVANNPDLNNGVKIERIFFFFFFLVLYYHFNTPEWFLFIYHVLFFLNLQDGQFRLFVLIWNWC